MASSLEFVQYICDQMRFAAPVTSRAMFGEYGLYAEGKFFASVCDDQLFLKPTCAVRALYSLPEQPAYPGAKPSILVENPEDAAFVSRLARLTLNALPLPRPRRKK